MKRQPERGDQTTSTPGWNVLLEEARTGFRSHPFNLPAYSEFMPPPYVGLKPTGEPDLLSRPSQDDHRWTISPIEEELELQPGLKKIAIQLLEKCLKLARSEKSAVSKMMIEHNPAVPGELQACTNRYQHRPLVSLLPLALSKTQDDKGRVRWTLFGTSHFGPGYAFWSSFHSPHHSANDHLNHFARLIAWTLGTPVSPFSELRHQGIRILPMANDPSFPSWEEQIPDFLTHLILPNHESAENISVLLTFRPFEKIPDAFRQAYLKGNLVLLPAPETLLFWYHPGYRSLAKELPEALHLPLLHLFRGSENFDGLRVPQSGWLDEKADAPSKDGKTTPQAKIRRSHRQQRMTREDPEEWSPELDDPVTVALFSEHPDHLGLYGKPMARNCQIWDEKNHLLLNGPTAEKKHLEQVFRHCSAGGRFGYRLLYPPMRIGPRSLYWHRPLMAKIQPDGTVSFFEEFIPGVLSAEREGHPSIPLFPQIEPFLLIDIKQCPVPVRPGEPKRAALHELRKIHEFFLLLGKPIPKMMAERLLSLRGKPSLEEWMAAFSRRFPDQEIAEALRHRVFQCLAPAETQETADSLTYRNSRERTFEEAFWKQIETLSGNTYSTKNNADPVSANLGKTGGPLGQALTKIASERTLDRLAEFLHAHYERLIDRHQLRGSAFCADQLFSWETEFAYPWSDGWKRNQPGKRLERNIVVVIPGKNRSEAVIMADHYDTAYMEDLYDPAKQGDRLRAAAAGADDNHSATATLMLGADLFFQMSTAGLLACDVWLVHLTGEEFPADCLGARAFAKAVVERNLSLTTTAGSIMDYSTITIKGAFVLDMIAHNNDRNPYVFQIATGEGRGAAQLAECAALANERWNTQAPSWNLAAGRQNPPLPRSQRLPPPARYPIMRGEIRPEWDPRSSLYNTDGQIFSDVGIPVVLFMEDYDIRRCGYHDTKDTMENIDLDYGTALAAIAIESVALAATDPRMFHKTIVSGDTP